MNRARALVVEDSPVAARLLAAQLRSYGFDVDTVQSGEEAVNACTASPPDLVLLDIELPGISGFATANQIRKLPIAQPRILGVTGRENAEDECLAAGMNGCVPKPVSRERLEQGLVSGRAFTPPGRDALASIRRIEELSGDRGLLKDTLQSFLMKTPGRLRVIASAAASGEVTTAKSIAHQLAGIASPLGLFELARVARLIAHAEDIPREQDLADLQLEGRAALQGIQQAYDAEFSR